jgi:hypothetical protein
VQLKFLALCYNRFYPQIHYSYENAWEHLNFHTLCTGRLHLLAPFLVNVYNGYKLCSLLETVNIRFPSRNFGDFPLFTVGVSRKNTLSLTLREEHRLRVFENRV